MSNFIKSCIFMGIMMLNISCNNDNKTSINTVQNNCFIYDIDFSSSIYPGSDIAYIYLIINDKKWESIIKEKDFEYIKVKGVKELDKIGIITRNPIISKNVCIIYYEFVMKNDVCEYVKRKKEILKNTELTIVAKGFKDSIIIKPIDVSYYKYFFDSLTKEIARPDNSKCK